MSSRVEWGQQGKNPSNLSLATTHAHKKSWIPKEKYNSKCRKLRSWALTAMASTTETFLIGHQGAMQIVACILCASLAMVTFASRQTYTETGLILVPHMRVANKSRFFVFCVNVYRNRVWYVLVPAILWHFLVFQRPICIDDFLSRSSENLVCKWQGQ